MLEAHSYSLHTELFLSDNLLLEVRHNSGHKTYEKSQHWTDQRIKWYQLIKKGPWAAQQRLCYSDPVCKWLMWLKRFFGPKFSYGSWLHSHDRRMTSHDCLERKFVVKVTAHARKVQLLLRSESVNCLAECLMRLNIIFTEIYQWTVLWVRHVMKQLYRSKC